MVKSYNTLGIYWAACRRVLKRNGQTIEALWDTYQKSSDFASVADVLFDDGAGAFVVSGGSMLHFGVMDHLTQSWYSRFIGAGFLGQYMHDPRMDDLLQNDLKYFLALRGLEQILISEKDINSLPADIYEFIIGNVAAWVIEDATKLVGTKLADDPYVQSTIDLVVQSITEHRWEGLAHRGYWYVTPKTKVNLRQGMKISPLVLDLDGDGVETTNVNDQWVMFDLDGDGVKNRTGWAGADDGFLVFDRN